MAKVDPVDSSLIERVTFWLQSAFPAADQEYLSITPHERVRRNYAAKDRPYAGTRTTALCMECSLILVRLNFE